MVFTNGDRPHTHIEREVATTETGVEFATGPEQIYPLLDSYFEVVRCCNTTSPCEYVHADP